MNADHLRLVGALNVLKPSKGYLSVAKIVLYDSRMLTRTSLVIGAFKLKGTFQKLGPAY